MAEMKKQVVDGELRYGGITDENDLKKNLAENCVPEEFVDMDIHKYKEFLEKRRILMAKFIHQFYNSLG